MTVELKPETARLVEEEISRGPFHSADEVIVQALYALREKSGVALVPPRTHKTLYDLLTQPPFAGSDLNLERQRDYPRPVGSVTGFLLDTNVLSEFSRVGEPDRHVDRWVKVTPEESLFASVLTFAECRGIELLPSGKRRAQLEQWQAEAVASFETRLLPVTKAIADRWAVLSAEAQRKGMSLANIDGLIAATALEHDLTLVTRNVKDFAGLGVKLLNPWEA